MPMYDRSCQSCGAVRTDCWEPIATPDMECSCGEGHFRRVWLAKASGVIGDECDVTVKHGLCNEDGSPRRWRSKAAMVAEARKRGIESHVTHIGSRGGDRSIHTT